MVDGGEPGEMLIRRNALGTKYVGDGGMVEWENNDFV